MTRYVAIDIETQSLEAKLRADVPIWSCAFAERDETGIVAMALPWNAAREHLVSLIKDESVTFLIHNAAFDVAALRVHGVDIPSGRYIDTLVLSYVIEPGAEHKLEVWGERLGYHKIQFHDFSQLTDEMLEYNQRDAEITVLLYEHLRHTLENELNDDRALDLYLSIELPYVEIIMEMEATGLYVDRTQLLPMREEFQRRINELRDEMLTICPFVPGKEKTYARGSYKRNGVEVFNHCELEQFNPNSNAHVSHYLTSLGWQPYERTPSGQPKLGAAILENIGDEYPLVPLLLEHDALTKIDGTFLNAFTENGDEHGVVRGSFNQCLTLTGRLSSSRP